MGEIFPQPLLLEVLIIFSPETLNLYVFVIFHKYIITYTYYSYIFGLFVTSDLSMNSLHLIRNSVVTEISLKIIRVITVQKYKIQKRVTTTLIPLFISYCMNS